MANRKHQERKGITPIIAIVILLLITIAIAGVAYTFITGVVTNTAGKTVQVTGTSCAADGSVVIYFQNVGTDTVTTPGTNAGDVQVKNGICVTSSGAGCNVSFGGIGANPVPFFSTPTVTGGASASVKVPCANITLVATSVATCKYDFLVAGRPAPVQVQCSDTVL